MRRSALTKPFIIGVVLLGLALPQSGLARRDGPGGPGKHRLGPPHIMFEKHAERLGLDAETLTQIRGISERAKEESSELHTKFREAKTTMRKLLSAEAPDKAAVMQQAEVMSEIMTSIRKIRLTALLDIRALLTPEQRQELIKIREERRSQRTHRDSRGPRAMDLDSRMSKLTERLGLTEKQQAEIRSILEHKTQKMQAMRDEARRLRQETDAKIQGLLTDEQRAQFSQLRKENQRMHGSGDWGGGKKGGGPARPY